MKQSICKDTKEYFQECKRQYFWENGSKNRQKLLKQSREKHGNFQICLEKEEQNKSNQIERNSSIFLTKQDQNGSNQSEFNQKQNEKTEVFAAPQQEAPFNQTNYDLEEEIRCKIETMEIEQNPGNSGNPKYTKLFREEEQNNNIDNDDQKQEERVEVSNLLPKIILQPKWVIEIPDYLAGEKPEGLKGKKCVRSLVVTFAKVVRNSKNASVSAEIQDVEQIQLLDCWMKVGSNTCVIGDVFIADGSCDQRVQWLQQNTHLLKLINADECMKKIQFRAVPELFNKGQFEFELDSLKKNYFSSQIKNVFAPSSPYPKSDYSFSLQRNAAVQQTPQLFPSFKDIWLKLVIEEFDQFEDEQIVLKTSDGFSLYSFKDDDIQTCNILGVDIQQQEELLVKIRIEQPFINQLSKFVFHHLNSINKDIKDSKLNELQYLIKKVSILDVYLPSACDEVEIDMEENCENIGKAKLPHTLFEIVFGQFNHADQPQQADISSTRGH